MNILNFGRFIISASLALGFASSALADTWFTRTSGALGPDPVRVGREGTADVYVCRASGIPGKLIARDGKCYIGYDGVEYAYTTYEVLQDPHGQFRFFAGSSLSDDYLVLGGSENGTALHICRVRVGNNLIAGKLVGGAQNGTCYYGYYGREYSSRVYDALTNA
jgi:hypothetical protein